MRGTKASFGAGTDPRVEVRERFDVAIVGAGAAGILAALAARRAVAPDGTPRAPDPDAPRVALLDIKERPGEKILISGGGRCNLTNESVSDRDFLTSRPNALRGLLREFPPASMRRLVESLGVPLRVEPLGKVFPRPPHRARQVLDALLGAVREAGIVARFGWRVAEIRRDADGGLGIDGRLAARRVVVATGGMSVPTTGSEGFGFDLAGRTGHRVVEPRPALVPLRCELPGDLAGLTTPAILTVRDTREGKVRARTAGSLLFTHRGLSGPAALDASLHLTRMDGEGKGAILEADLWTLTDPEGEWAPFRGLPKPPGACLAVTPPSEREAEIERLVVDRAIGRSASLRGALEARLPRRLVEAIVPAARTSLAELTREARREAVRRLLRFPFPIRDHEGFRRAEATSGGVSLEELDRRTLESRVLPGLHFCGEVVDVTGRLGGFNFQWAWSSGWVAGRGAAR
jgi:hypothetical protein